MSRIPLEDWRCFYCFGPFGMCDCDERIARAHRIRDAERRFHEMYVNPPKDRRFERLCRWGAGLIMAAALFSYLIGKLPVYVEPVLSNGFHQHAVPEPCDPPSCQEAWGFRNQAVNVSYAGDWTSTTDSVEPTNLTVYAIACPVILGPDGKSVDVWPTREQIKAGECPKWPQ